MTPNRKSQRQRILDLLISARGWVPAPELARISLQYSARVKELRTLGFRIVNRLETHSGVRHGFFKLEAGMPAKVQPASKSPAPDALFSPEELHRCAPSPRYPD